MSLLKEYTEFTRTTAIYPEANTGDMAAIMACTLGLGEEVGEVIGKLYKMGRDGWSKEMFKERVKPELGDVFWQFVRLCDELGFSLESILEENRAKLEDRQQRQMIKGEGDTR